MFAPISANKPANVEVVPNQTQGVYTTISAGERGAVMTSVMRLDPVAEV
jgi:hypothetical protein